MRREGIPRRTLLQGGIGLGVAALAGLIGYEVGLRSNSSGRRPDLQPTPETLGGLWVTPSPPEGATITSNILHLAAQAYKINGGSAVTDVQFTAYWDGAPSPDPEKNPRGWPILADVSSSDEDQIYRADIDLNAVRVGDQIFRVPAGKITISFDIYNATGERKLAPNGEHHINYQPSS